MLGPKAVGSPIEQDYYPLHRTLVRISNANGHIAQNLNARATSTLPPTIRDGDLTQDQANARKTRRSAVLGRIEEVNRQETSALQPGGTLQTASNLREVRPFDLLPAASDEEYQMEQTNQRTNPQHRSTRLRRNPEMPILSDPIVMTLLALQLEQANRRPLQIFPQIGPQLSSAAAKLRDKFALRNYLRPYEEQFLNDAAFVIFLLVGGVLISLLAIYVLYLFLHF
jgi:hypothetical protein